MVALPLFDGELRGRIQRGPEITGSINAHGQDQDCQAQKFFYFCL
ncbi:hypothetical protein BDL97_12G088900 [Sphagnum fallax]|nr:hypothetical protein BDL97_12G088900 [Sphagnum fallax]